MMTQVAKTTKTTASGIEPCDAGCDKDDDLRRVADDERRKTTRTTRTRNTKETSKTNEYDEEVLC
jgi:hypothetical protein